MTKTASISTIAIRFKAALVNRCILLPSVLMISPVLLCRLVRAYQLPTRFLTGGSRLRPSDFPICRCPVLVQILVIARPDNVC